MLASLPESALRPVTQGGPSTAGRVETRCNKHVARVGGSAKGVHRMVRSGYRSGCVCSGPLIEIVCHTPGYIGSRQCF